MYGIKQPINGMLIPVACFDMPRMRKGPAPKELLQARAALAANLRAHLAANHKTRDLSETAAAEAIGRATGIGKNTVLRALGSAADEVDIRLDTLVRLAIFFGISALELLRDHSLPAVRKAPRSIERQQQPARDQRKEADVERASLHRSRRA